LLISQADALQQIAELKHENFRLRTELAKLGSANIELQARITGLEQNTFEYSNKKVVKILIT